MTAAPRPQAPPSLTQTRIMAVLRAEHSSEYPPVVDALVAGGVRSIEFTLSTAGVIDGFADLRSRWGADIDLGVGTVTDIRECHDALNAGADFIVTPTSDSRVVRACVEAGVPVFPGGLTPTELHDSWLHGASAVKLFPAATVGPAYIAQLRGPFPGLEVVPSGGVAIADIPAWLSAGAMAVSLGGPLLQDAFVGGDLKSLTERAHRAVAIAEDAEARR